MKNPVLRPLEDTVVGFSRINYTGMGGTNDTSRSWQILCILHWSLIKNLPIYLLTKSLFPIRDQSHTYKG